MNIRLVLITIAIAGLCAWGIWAKVSQGPDSAQALAEVPTSFPPDSLAGVIEVTEDVPLASLAEPGRITVVDIYDSRCPACRQLDSHLNGLAARRPDICIKKIRNNDHWRAECNVRYVPTVVLFDARGKIIARDSGEDRTGSNALVDWINAERKRQWDAARSR